MTIAVLAGEPKGHHLGNAEQPGPVGDRLNGGE
jgi:hypothetical protein